MKADAQARTALMCVVNSKSECCTISSSSQAPSTFEEEGEERRRRRRVGGTRRVGFEGTGWRSARQGREGTAATAGPPLLQDHLEHRQKDDAQEVDEADRGGHLLAEGSREHWVHSGEALARAARGDGAQR